MMINDLEHGKGTEKDGKRNGNHYGSKNTGLDALGVLGGVKEKKPDFTDLSDITDPLFGGFGAIGG